MPPSRGLAVGKSIIHRFGVRGGRRYEVFGPTRFVITPHEQPSYSGTRRGAAAVLASSLTKFLPDGYPSSVGADYLAYSLWTNVNMTIGCAAGVLSTQALLCAVGVGQTSALPMAASLNWVLKDGLGQLAAVLSAYLISDRFDADPKRWRFAAAACEVAARSLEAAAPFAPGSFLLLASTANLGKSIACLAASATKASFHLSLTRRQNLSDITGKAGSQAIVASLIGTGLGLGLSASMLSSPQEALPVVLGLGALQLLTTEWSLQALALPTLTRRAGTALLHAHLKGVPLPSPAELAHAESHLFGTRLQPALARLSMLPKTAPQICIGSAALDELAPSPAELESLLRSCDGSKHLVCVSGSDSAASEVRVLLLEDADPVDVLLAFVHATMLQRGLADGAAPDVQGHHQAVRDTLLRARSEVPQFMTSLREAGWNISTACQLEDTHSRIAFDAS